jgi:cell division protein FtsL
MKGKDLGWKIFTIACAALVPILFALNAMQADRYMKAQDEIKQLEQKQVELVEENKRLITDISLLSSGERVGKVAEEELGMRKAESEEIVRVEMRR